MTVRRLNEMPQASDLSLKLLEAKVLHRNTEIQILFNQHFFLLEYGISNIEVGLLHNGLILNLPLNFLKYVLLTHCLDDLLFD